MSRGRGMEKKLLFLYHFRQNGGCKLQKGIGAKDLAFSTWPMTIKWHMHLNVRLEEGGLIIPRPIIIVLIEVRLLSHGQGIDVYKQNNTFKIQTQFDITNCLSLNRKNRALYLYVCIAILCVCGVKEKNVYRYKVK